MSEPKKPFKETMGLGMGDSSGQNTKTEKSSQKEPKAKKNNSADGELLLKLPGGFEYRLPSKRQRVIVASLVLGLNVILLIAVAIYFYNPSFQEFIYNFGRD